MASAASSLIAAFPSDLKLSNRMQILELFKAGGQYTVNDIVDQIGVSRQTVMKAIHFFIEKGLIVSMGKANSTNVGGKRPELFSLSPNSYLLSISFWPTTLHMTLLNFRFEVVDSIHLDMEPPALVDAATDTIGRLSQDLLRHNQIDPSALYGVCISTSGIVNYKTNALKFNSLSPAWGRDIPIADKLRPYFAPDTPILVENVAKVVGRSLLHERRLQDKRILTVFSSWGGVCGCFIEKGQIMNGKDSLIGEIGHMVLLPDDQEPCGCGSHGCFERLVSNERLRKTVAATREQHPESMLAAIPIQDLTVQTVFLASSRGDQYAQELSCQLARYFAMALRNVSLIFDPDLVVFQGDYANANDLFLQQFHQALNEFRYYPSAGPFLLELDRRPIEELDISGAYTLLLDHLFSDAALYE